MDWTKAKKEYLTTGISQRALAKKYGVSLTAIRNRSVSEKWVAARIQIKDKTTTKTIEKVSEIASEAQTVLYEAALDIARQLAGLVKTGEYPTGWKPRDISGALKDCRDILDLKSEADIEEQRARIEKLRASAAADEKQTSTIDVTFGGKGAEWAE